uniref:Uncharacterized protein n=1 Tax=Oryza barthii TaxID=65489 RepID=A0A0D3FV80_9ORYZ
MAAGPRLAMQKPSTILAPPLTTQQKQQGTGFGSAVAPPPSPRGIPMVAGPRPASQTKRKKPNVAPPQQQKIQGFGGAGAAAGPAPVSSSARAMAAVAEKAAAAETEDEARARERAAAEQIAHEDARKDFVTPLASVEDAISSSSLR